MTFSNQDKIIRLIYSPKWSAIAICVIFLIGLLVARYIEILFRFSDYRWIYQYGSLLSKGIVLLMFGCSFIHPILVVSTRGKEWSNYWFWMLVALVPFLYISLGMTVSIS